MPRCWTGGLAAIFLAAVAGCVSGRASSASAGPIAQAEQQARAAIQAEQDLAGRPLTEKSVGVPAFGVQVRDTSLAALGYGLADLLLGDLARTQRLVVVERLRLDAILRELQLASSGRVDERTAPRVGRLVQARYLVLGRIVEMPGGQIRIDTRVAEVPTANIGRSLAFSAPLARLLDAEKQLALRIFEELGVPASPQLRAEMEQPATRNFAALLAFSRGARSVANRQLPEAAAEYQNALALDPAFTAARTRLAEVRSELSAPTQSARGGRRTAGNLALEQVSSIMPLSLADRPGGPVDPGYPTTRAFLIINVRGR